MDGWWTDTKDTFGNLGDWFSQRVGDVTDTVGDLNAEWQRQVNRLKDKAAEFSRVFTKLEQRQPLAEQSPVLKHRYDRVMKLGLNVRQTVQGITGKIDAALRGFQDLFGLSPNMAGMGAVPLVPIAVIAGAIAAITAWLTDAYALDRQLDSLDSQIKAGVDPVVAGDNIAKSGDQPLIDVANPFKGATGLILGGVALYFFWPTLRRQWKKLS